MLKIDFHTHPLAHKHYPDIVPCAKLDEHDKRAVEAMIQWGISRGLDGIAITDHNQFTSGLYGKDYAAKKGLPIKVMAGAEMSVMIGRTEIHILALGVREAFAFDPYADVNYLIDSIHMAGGIAVMSHPHYYDERVFGRLRDSLDGVEVYNGVAAELGYPFHVPPDYAGLQFKNSDYHGDRFALATQLAGYTEVDENNRTIMRRFW